MIDPVRVAAADDHRGTGSDQRAYSMPADESGAAEYQNRSGRQQAGRLRSDHSHPIPRRGQGTRKAAL